MEQLIDLSIYENGNGGDTEYNYTGALFNMVYLALFGGNPEAATTGDEIETEQRFDFWANSTLFENAPEIQFNSTTENLLNNIQLSSSGRIEIERAVKLDLDFMSNFAEVEVEVTIVTVDRVSINIFLKKLANLEEKEFQFIWDSTQSEIIESRWL